MSHHNIMYFLDLSQHPAILLQKIGHHDILLTSVIMGWNDELKTMSNPKSWKHCLHLKAKKKSKFVALNFNELIKIFPYWATFLNFEATTLRKNKPLGCCRLGVWIQMIPEVLQMDVVDWSHQPCTLSWPDQKLSLVDIVS